MTSGSIRSIMLLGSAFAGTMLAAPALAQQTAADAPEAGVAEIIVTATKSSQNLQDVPISIQAISNAKLDQLQVQAFDDYVRFLPSVTYQTAGPGSAKIYFRGVSSGENANHSTSQPTVGIYLDEQPVTTITGPIDLHIYDMQRVEALAGPQGTLYGSSSLAGTLRLITSKPDASKFSAGVDLEINNVQDGAWGGVAEAFINAPLGEGIAVRAVGWYDKDAGFIDNVLQTRTFPTSGVKATTAPYVKDNYNDVETIGGRIALGIDLNDEWTITPMVMGQKQTIHGFFGQETAAKRPMPKRTVAQYNPEFGRDDWWQASLTVEGKIGNWDLVYSGGYMKRSQPYDSDYSDYAYFYDALYGSGAFIYDNAGKVISPNQYIKSRPKFSRQSHELRISSPQSEPLRVIAGLFYQRQVNNIEENYIIDNIADSITVPGTASNIWLTRQDRTDRDYAAFGEVSYDVTDKLTLTGGARVYRYDNSLIGFFGYSAGYSSRTGVSQCFAPAVVSGTPCTNLDRETKKTDWLAKANATYKIDDDKLVYFTFSQGFRPGGINRRGGLAPYQPDKLDNFELGFKTSWADNMVRFNGAIYQENWNNIQFSALGENGLTVVTNAGDARIRGVEFDLTLAPTPGLTLSAGGSYNDAKLVTNFCAFANAARNCATPGPGGQANSILAPEGTRLPDTARFKGNALARYEFDIGSLTAHMQGAVVYEGDRVGDLRTATRQIVGDFPAYTTVDLTFGVKKDSWTAELYATNLFDSNGITSRSVQCGETVCGDPSGVTASGGIFYQYVIRPRTIGLKVGTRF
ncbi:MAG: TonB-dependent receptor [Alphaproteobacteria bacterium PA4]|nr:MAG: TonB-dependent receptor [Alphaproteobacteria bacterium PA4]